VRRTGQEPREGTDMSSLVAPVRRGKVQLSDKMMEQFMKFYEGKYIEAVEKQGGSNKVPITGNLYMYRTLADFGHYAGIIQQKPTLFMKIALNIVILLQMFAPICLIISSVNKIEFGVNGRHFGYTNFAAYEFGSEDHGISHVFMRVLGLLFLILFCMNGLYVLHHDKTETKKVAEMSFLFRAVAQHRPARPVRGCSGSMWPFGAGVDPELVEQQNLLGDQTDANIPVPLNRWLWAGAFLNSLCLFGCAFAMVFMFIVEDSPKELVLDAFGLAFLYNMDDLGGDLAFMDEAWDEEFMGTLYGEMKEAKLDLMEEATKERKRSFTPDRVYKGAIWIMTVLSFLLPLMYVFLEMKPKPSGGGAPPAPVYDPRR